MKEQIANKWYDHVSWSSTREALQLHWKKLLAGLVVAVSVVVMGALCFCTTSARTQPTAPCETASSPAPIEVPDTCPWQLVMSDLTHRLRLLEMAFKEQVIAREVIAAEVTNQSYSNLELERKLDEFVSSIKHLSTKLDKLKEQLSEMSSRLHSDECLGFLVLLFVIIQIILAVRTRIRDKQGHGQGVKVHTTQTHNGSTMNTARTLSNNSVNGMSLSPKQSVSFKQDACVITFSKGSKEHISAHADTLLAYVTDGVKFPIKQSYLIDSQDALKECPRADVYLVFVDTLSLSDELTGSENVVSDDADVGLKHQTDSNLKMTSLRLLNLSCGIVILVLTNEFGSQQLPDHALYNANLPLIQSYDVLQELAFNGRLLSIWKDLSLYQLSHIKKTGRSIFGMKAK